MRTTPICTPLALLLLLASACTDPPATGTVTISLRAFHPGESRIESITLTPLRLEALWSATADGEPEVIVLLTDLPEVTAEVHTPPRDQPIAASPVPPGFIHELRLVSPDGVIAGSVRPHAMLKFPSGHSSGIKIQPRDGEPFAIREAEVTSIVVLLDVEEEIHGTGCVGQARDDCPVEYILHPELPAIVVAASGRLSPQYPDDELFVMLADGTTRERADTLASMVGGTIDGQVPGHPWYRIVLPAGSDEFALADVLATETDVRSASPNWHIHLMNALPGELEVANQFPGFTYDPWWISTIAADDAWDDIAAARGEDARYGLRGPVVALPDANPYPLTPDLEENFRFNPGELGAYALRGETRCTPLAARIPLLVAPGDDRNGDGVLGGIDWDVSGDGVITLSDFNDDLVIRARLNDAIAQATGDARAPDQLIRLIDLLRPDGRDRDTPTCGLFEDTSDGSIGASVADGSDVAIEPDAGRIDDIVGWNIVVSPVADNWTYVSPTDPGARDPFAQANVTTHGTLTGGIIAAVANDRSLLAGVEDLESYVGIAPRAAILPIAFLRTGAQREIVAGERVTGEALDDVSMMEMVEALAYAVEQGADVINASWSSKCAPEKTGVPPEFVCDDTSRARKRGDFEDAFAELEATVRIDRVLMVTTGVDFFVDLDRADVDDLPSELHRPYMIAVTGSDEMDALQEVLSYGDETYDLAAPGRRMAGLSDVGRSTDFLGNPVVGLETTEGMVSLSAGTSVAAPQVTGTAALMMSLCPSLRGRADELRRLLIENADCGLPGLAERVRGACRLNVQRAVRSVMPEYGGACAP